MTSQITEDQVREQAEAKGLWLVPVPGEAGRYSFTRPPGTTPLTDMPLTLEGCVQWLSGN